MAKICTLVPRLWLNTNAVGRSCSGTVIRWFVVLSVASTQDENIQEPHPWDGILGTLFWQCFRNFHLHLFIHFISFYFRFIIYSFLFGIAFPRGGTPLMLFTGRLRAELQPLPFYVQKRYHFRVRSIDKWYPFHIPSHTPRCISFNCKCAVV